jgi:hypothetical protein
MVSEVSCDEGSPTALGRVAAQRGAASGLVSTAPVEKQAMTRLRQLSQAAGLVNSSAFVSKAPAGGGAGQSLLSQVPVREVPPMPHDASWCSLRALCSPMRSIILTSEFAVAGRGGAVGMARAAAQCRRAIRVARSPYSCRRHPHAAGRTAPFPLQASAAQKPCSSVIRGIICCAMRDSPSSVLGPASRSEGTGYKVPFCCSCAFPILGVQLSSASRLHQHLRGRQEPR